jgi:hypothetical protein
MVRSTGVEPLVIFAVLREAVLDTMYGKSSYKDVARETHFTPITVSIILLVSGHWMGAPALTVPPACNCACHPVFIPDIRCLYC